MSEWQPTDAQVEAARTARTKALRSFDAKPFAQQTPEYLDEVNNEAMRAALIAAHEAAEPVDTTEFEAAVTVVMVKAAQLEDMAQWRDWESYEHESVEVRAAIQHLIDLYVKAVTR